MNDRFDLHIITHHHSEIYGGYFRRLVFGNSLTIFHIPLCFHAKPPNFPSLFNSRELHYISNMSPKVKCPDCSWVGERSLATDHYARVHCTLANSPYACKVGMYTTGFAYILDKQIMRAPHLRKVKKSGQDAETLIIQQPHLLYDNIFVVTGEPPRELGTKSKRTDEKPAKVKKMKTAPPTNDRMVVIDLVTTNVIMPPSAPTHQRHSASPDGWVV